MPSVLSACLRQLALVGALTFSLHCPAADTREDAAARLMAAEISKMYGTTAQLDSAVVMAYGTTLSPAKTAVARDYLRAVFMHPEFARYIAGLLTPLANESGFRLEQIASATGYGILQLQVNGLGRLSPEQQMVFVRHSVALSRAITSTECKGMMLQQLDMPTMRRLERDFIVRQPLEKFEAIVQLYKAASLAELSGYPDPRTIDANQAKLAEAAFVEVMRTRFRQELPEAAIQRVSADAANSPAEEVCAFYTAIFEGMLTMKEPYRSWQLTRFMESMK